VGPEKIHDQLFELGEGGAAVFGNVKHYNVTNYNS
jgi:hypothetical protein